MGRAVVGVSVALVMIVVGFLATYVAFRTVELDAALSAPLGPNSGPYWHLGTRALHYSFGGLGRNLHVSREYVAMNLPDARHSFPIRGHARTIASADLITGQKAVAAYVLPSGDFMSCGFVTPLATGLLRERESMLAEVRRGFGRTPLRRLMEEGSLSEIRLAFDGDARWQYASAVLGVLAEYDLRSTPILWNVGYPPIGEQCALRCTLREGEDRDPTAAGYLDIHLAGAVGFDEGASYR